jgi:NADPH-dependent 2,4-dienoyl-CoA reductase/sulfur reductase-like enzyme
MLTSSKFAVGSLRGYRAGFRLFPAAYAAFCTSSSINNGGRGLDKLERVCIVGTGPAGFYCAKYLLKEHPGVKVDMLDLLPTPFGMNAVESACYVAQCGRCV